MMPLSLLAALFLAFGLDPGASPSPLPRDEVFKRVGEVLAGLALIAAAAFLLGRVVTFLVARRGYASSALRLGYSWGARAVDLLTLAVYGAIIREAGWPQVVRAGFGLGDVVFVGDVLILLPFLLAQVVGWWGLYAAERALRASGAARVAGASLGRYLVLKGRQSVGLLLPVLLVFSIGQDAVRRVWPPSVASAWAQPVGLAVMGVVVMVLSPLFVRLAWPTRPLPPGPLRSRLERISRRVGFRCTDILVWDTGHVLVNAGVTGALPWFRYVLLSDALVEYLDPYEVAAVFGHEVGHIAHRHLVYFGFFFAGSLAVLALAGWASETYLMQALALAPVPLTPTVKAVAEGAVLVLLLGFYFLVVFGHLSRRFERQADVFGCRAVSCGRADCPPHADLDARPGAPPPADLALCPVGIRIFVNALGNVAALNGIGRAARSWRHGSIDRRIAFLEALEGRPEAERRFQRGVRRLRLALALLLAAAVVAAYQAEAGKYLR